jgi:hypothetical protein
VKGDRPNRAARAAKKKTMNTDQNNNQIHSGLSNRPEQLNPDTNTEKEASSLQDIFGDVIYTYTRKQALEDGFQVDVSKTAKEAGFRFRVFLTRAVFDKYVTVPEGVAGQDEAGRLWDILWMLRSAIRCMPDGISRVPFVVLVRNDNRRAKPVGFVAECGACDIHDPSPAITVMLPDED